MLELEKKHVKAYYKEKKELKTYNKKINLTETEFHKIFYYISNEYYYNLKKEFNDSEIIEKCNISIDILNEIKELFKKKELAIVDSGKIIISYETIIFLDNIINNYKNYYMISPITILTFFLSTLSLISSIFDFLIIKVVAIIGLIIYILLLFHIIKQKIYKLSQYK